MLVMVRNTNVQESPILHWKLAGVKFLNLVGGPWLELE